MNDTDQPSLVVKFSSTAAGELVCRVTDVITHRSWVVPNARAVLDRLQSPVKASADETQHGGAPLRVDRTSEG